jgi:superoxide dismutase, Fe-Mn family
MHRSSPAFTACGLPLRAAHDAPHSCVCASAAPQPPAGAAAAPRLGRRAALALGAALAAGFALPRVPAPRAATDDVPPVSDSSPVPDVPFVLPPLPYGYGALEPAIDRETMILHHDKHFAKYTEGTNAALAKLGGAGRLGGDPAALAALLAGLDDVTSDVGLRRALRNNGGGYLNHYQFFATLAPPNAARAAAGPEGDLAADIAAKFGGFDQFRTAFEAASLGLFGSGFVYLVKDISAGGELAIKSYANQDSPVMTDDVPVLGLDLWEHAYYKRYGPKRADYIASWWSVVNWPTVSAAYTTPSKAASTHSSAPAK